MIQHIKDTKSKELDTVYFDDINELVSSKEEAFLVTNWYLRYFSTKEAAEKYISKFN